MTYLKSWVEVENIILSEVIQVQEEKHHVFLMWDSLLYVCNTIG